MNRPDVSEIFKEVETDDKSGFYLEFPKPEGKVCYLMLKAEESRTVYPVVLSREQIEQHVWDFDYEGGSNMVDVYIRYLRRKLDEGYEKKLIHTVRGAGYVMREQP